MKSTPQSNCCEPRYFCLEILLSLWRKRMGGRLSKPAFPNSRLGWSAVAICLRVAKMHVTDGVESARRVRGARSRNPDTGRIDHRRPSRLSSSVGQCCWKSSRNAGQSGLAPAGTRKYWTRRGVAEWACRAAGRRRTSARRDCPRLLVSAPLFRSSVNRRQRLLPARAAPLPHAAAPVARNRCFISPVQRSVAKSTYAGIPWLRFHPPTTG